MDDALRTSLENAAIGGRTFDPAPRWHFLFLENRDILQDLLQKEGLDPGIKYLDCGVLMYDLVTQDVHAGGSGCGCSAAVLAGHILPAMERGVWNRVLFAGTGALMSPLTCQQGCSIPGVCHAVTIERRERV